MGRQLILFVFSRHKSSVVEVLDTENLKVMSTLSDTRHEMIMKVYISYPNLVIKDIDAQMIRMPDDECTPAQENIKKIIGLEIGPGFKKNVLQRIGDKYGCTHLTDMVLESAKSAIQANFTLRYQQLDKQERTKLLKIELKDNCVLYMDKSNNK